jgi:hypothetical protein
MVSMRSPIGFLTSRVRRKLIAAAISRRVMAVEAMSRSRFKEMDSYIISMGKATFSRPRIFWSFPWQEWQLG